MNKKAELTLGTLILLICLWISFLGAGAVYWKINFASVTESDIIKE